MANTLKLDAEIRQDMGKGASRRLRHADKIPAIVYGAGKDPQPIMLEHRKVIKALENEDFYTQILSLNIGKKTEKVVLKDMQRHVIKPKITHMDFLRIKADEALTMLIPIHFVGEEETPGVQQSGTISHHISEVEIRCLPADLPKHLELDVSKMELNDSMHLSDLQLPKGVEFATPIDEEHDQPVISIHLAKIAEAPAEVKEEAPTEEAEATAEGATENNKE